MKTSDELANPDALTPEAAEPFVMTPEMQELMRQWSASRKPVSRHATARAERAKARIAKRKKKR